MSEPLIRLEKIRREFQSGDTIFAALKDIDLTIEAGEMVAIIGASGSGKSTLMHILGCLDRATSGSYRISGTEIESVSGDELAELRREHFGFIFQRYHLLSELSALGNVEIPAVYAGSGATQRGVRAAAILDRLGIADRADHRPSQLSGGQQQRVSIARALMNDAEVILADEPTGALDKHSGEEVLRILKQLNSEGRTVIIVTHDPAIASLAERIIEISDGVIISDKRSSDPERTRAAKPNNTADLAPKQSATSLLGPLMEAFGMALVSMWAHKLRAFLTMLGIIIGIASVVSVVALGQGSQQQVLENISSLGTNSLEIFAGKTFGDVRSGRITTLVVDDATQLAKQPYAQAVTPTVSTSSTIRFGSTEANAQVNGVGAQYFAAKGLTLSKGQLFNSDSVHDYSQEVVIDENTKKSLFADKAISPIGQTVFVGKIPLRVIGLVSAEQGGFGSSQNLSLYLPYTTVQARFLGDSTLRSITIRVKDDFDMDYVQEAVTSFLTQRHGTKDFYILNTDDIRETITSTTQTMTILIGSIAVISLIVGGIGVMNIMLVSVSERISEIGVRMAVGARQSDILRQFLIEAVLVCFVGGFAGIGLALAFGAVFSLFSLSFSLVYSTTSIVAAVLCSSLIGIAFGYLPARNASRLDPVEALSGD
ncbi:MacB family efflux pump subunit [Cohaesibacter celericrescens]|uniref:Pyoverdine export ATP-binding/permease protein PvdT n=1 Tax=Cohaesibacter celericrescens TaxID=2067669 RepID=A0A2N5XNI8_9HYPH|nr:MacB family efflux pump subunit [Cohaesibacter celericrescens]PLW76073.1 macrolide ABC transporter permease/ATP-binding protein MacB [Cohaesibacter celericrescens]